MNEGCRLKIADVFEQQVPPPPPTPRRWSEDLSANRASQECHRLSTDPASVEATTLRTGVVITSRFGFRHWLARSQECVSRTLLDWEDRLRFGPKGRDSKAQGNALGMRGTTNAKPQRGATRVTPRWGFGAIGLREPQGCRPGLSSEGPLGHCNQLTPNSNQRMKASRELIAAPFLNGLRNRRGVTATGVGAG